MYTEPNAEIFRLRSALRDLVSVSTIPVAWLGREPSEIAAGLADVLTGSLYLDFVFVRLCDPTSGATVEVTRGDAWNAFPRWLQEHLASAGRLSGKAVIPDVGDGAQPCRGLLVPLGVNAEGGLVAAACRRIDFPAEIDQLLVSVAANHAATAFQSSRAAQDLRRARRELETKVAERTAELRRASAELQTILDSSPVGIALFGRDQAIQRCNPAFERILGWKADIAHRPASLPETNPSFEGFLQRIHPEDRNGVIEALDKATREKTDFEMDLRAVHLDGTMRYLRGIGHPVFNASGDVVETVGTVTDLTERRQRDDERERLLASERTALAEAVAAQQRFRDLVNSVEGIVWEADVPGFQFTFVSNMAERILGYPVERWLTEPTFWKDHLHPDDRDWALQSCQDGIICKRDRDFEYRMIAADGRVVWLRDLVTVVVEGDRATRVRGVMVDITERKQAEQERQAHLWFLESMDRVNRAIQGTNDLEQMMSDVLEAMLSIFECDRSWLVYPCDPEAASWNVPMEHARPEFPGAFVLGHDLPVDPEIAKAFETVRASSSPVQFGRMSEHPLPSGAEERFRIQSMIAMAIHPKGDRPYMLGLHQCSYPRTWTPREERLFQEVGRRLEDALTSLFMFRNLGESERRLEEAQRISHVGYWERDLATNHYTWSDENYRIFGLRPQERLLSFDEVQGLLHPADRQMRAAAVAEALRGGPRYDVEYRVVRPNGEVRFVRSVGDVVRDESARPRRVFGTVQDITERKRGEHRRMAQHAVTQILAEAATLEEATPRILRAVCECVVWDVGALWRTDREGGVLRCVEVWHNESTAVPEFEADSRERTFTPGSGLPGRVWSSREPAYVSDLVHDSNFLRAPIATREGLHAAFGFPIVLGGEVLGVMEFFSHEIRPADRDLLNMTATIGSQIGQFIERKQAEDALHYAQAELAHVTRVATLGELTASIAHEINQPLAAVVNNATACVHWLAAHNLEEARESAEFVIADGHRAGEIIGRIRALVKKAPSRKDRVDVNETILEVIALARSEVHSNDVSLRTRFDDDLPRVLGDRIQLQQVILNLMINAIEAMT